MADLIVPPPTPDLTGYAKLTDIPPPPDLSGYATTGSVAAVQAAIPASPDLTPYATKTSVTALAATVPTASMSVPPGVQVGGAVGSAATTFSLADHTHATSVQRTRMQVAGGAGIVTWTFPTPYSAGVIPNCFALVEATVGAAAASTVQLNGTPTNTSVSFKVFGPPTVTVGVLGTAVNVAFPVAANGVWVHVQASKPTQ